MRERQRAGITLERMMACNKDCNKAAERSHRSTPATLHKVPFSVDRQQTPWQAWPFPGCAHSSAQLESANFPVRGERVPHETTRTGMFIPAHFVVVQLHHISTRSSSLNPILPSAAHLMVWCRSCLENGSFQSSAL